MSWFRRAPVQVASRTSPPLPVQYKIEPSVTNYGAITWTLCKRQTSIDPFGYNPWFYVEIASNSDRTVLEAAMKHLETPIHD
jgi:hypothetical protein